MKISTEGMIKWFTQSFEEHRKNIVFGILPVNGYNYIRYHIPALVCIQYNTVDTMTKFYVPVIAIYTMIGYPHCFCCHRNLSSESL